MKRSLFLKWSILCLGILKRGENMPSIEVAAKMADALDVTLDYLVKDGEYEQLEPLP
jgi:transcriptional regulator with XRE-family HTH domain